MNDYQQFLVATLEGGLSEVVGLVRAFPSEDADRDIRPGEWTLRRHVHHLRQIEGRYHERLAGVLAQGEYVPRLVEHAPPDDVERLEDMLAGFVASRERALAIYRGLTADQWKLVFTHPTIWGAVTVEWWAERFIQHTAEHLEGLWMMKQLTGLTSEAYERVLPNVGQL